MKLDKILLTTDLSEASLRACEPLADVARNRGSTVTLLHIVEDMPVIPHGAPLAPRQSDPAIEEETTAARAWVKANVDTIAPGMVTETVVIRSAKVADAIIEFAEQGDFDLIAMSTHGRTGVRHLLVGSVAESVIRRSSRPVLVFPRPK